MSPSIGLPLPWGFSGHSGVLLGGCRARALTTFPGQQVHQGFHLFGRGGWRCGPWAVSPPGRNSCFLMESGTAARGCGERPGLRLPL